MDPLSVTASIIAVSQLAETLLKTVRAIKSASEDRKSLVIEISALRGILNTLQETLDDIGDEEWATTTQLLNAPDGPLPTLKTALGMLLQALGVWSPNASSNGKVSKLRSAATALVWPFKEGEVKKRLETIGRQKSLLSLALDNDHLALSRAIRDDTQSMLGKIKKVEMMVEGEIDKTQRARNEEISRRLQESFEAALKWFAPVDYLAKQKDVFRLYLEGTADWFMEHSSFVKWKQSEQRTLFCTGIPGAGKTVLASAIIDHLTQIAAIDKSVGVAWIYFDYKQQQSQTLGNLLAALYMQLTRQTPEFIDDASNLVISLQRSYRSAYRPTVKECVSVLERKIATFEKVFFVLDALDECDKDRSIRDEFLEEIQNLDNKVHILVTSRDAAEIDDATVERIDMSAPPESIEKY
ncbi:hypothetical protein NA57DRAFT_20483, partial [Rhizodiscina lignyota]